MKILKELTKQRLAKLLCLIFILGTITPNAFTLPQIALTSSAAPQAAAQAAQMAQAQRTQQPQKQQQEAQPGILEKIVNKLSFLDPDFVSNKFFVQPVYKLAAPFVKNIPMGDNLIQMGIPMAKWAAKLALGLGLNLITGTWGDSAILTNNARNQEDKLEYATPMKALNATDNNNTSGWLRLIQAGGIRNKMPLIKNITNDSLKKFITITCKAHNAYALAETVVMLKQIFANTSQTMAASRQGGPNPFIKLISAIGSGGMAIHNLATYKPGIKADEAKEQNKSKFTTLSNAMQSKNLHFTAPAMAADGMMAISDGQGLMWGMSNALNIAKTSLKVESVKNFAERNHLKWWGLGAIATTVTGLAIWAATGEDEPEANPA
ncbi:hypothetical protein KAU11_02540 [Candidatus Babeliales bacterium]|nr:hypothetical protein [Candidatus Babeliales bacterium]